MVDADGVSSKAMPVRIVRESAPGIDTVGYASEPLITVTSRLLTLLAPRKLLSVTEIVYTPSTGKSALGTEVGAVKLKPELRNAAAAEPSPCSLVTVNTGASQARPPEPDEADMSRDSGEQPLTVLGTDNTTTGAVGETGA